MIRPAELLAGVPEAAVEVGGRVVSSTRGQAQIGLDGVARDVALDSGEPPVLGAWIVVRGRWTGSCIEPTGIEVVQAPHRDVGRRDSAFVQGLTGTVAMLQRRHTALRAIRAFFDERGFTEVETPTAVRSPGMELHLEALEVLGVSGPHWLRTSPEYHLKRLLGSGMSRIYELGKAYRRGERGSLHEPEFTMLEWYRAFSGSEELMADTEALVAQLATKLLGTTRLRTPRGTVDVAPPWERLTAREAFARYAQRDLDALVRDEDALYRTLAEQVEPQLGQGRPTFLTHYPKSMASLARLRADDPSCADRFEAYVDGIELCNGFGELTDPVEQRRRFEADRAARREHDRPVYPLDERLLEALEDGLPPSGGNALGVDRLLMLLAGTRQIGDVVAFPFERA